MAVRSGYDSNGCAGFTAQQTVLIPNAIWSLISDQMSIAFWVNQDPNHFPGSNWPGPWGCARLPEFLAGTQLAAIAGIYSDTQWRNRYRQRR